MYEIYFYNMRLVLINIGNYFFRGIYLFFKGVGKFCLFFFYYVLEMRLGWLVFILLYVWLFLFVIILYKVLWIVVRK